MIGSFIVPVFCVTTLLIVLIFLVLSVKAELEQIEKNIIVLMELIDKKRRK